MRLLIPILFLVIIIDNVFSQDDFSWFTGSNYYERYLPIKYCASSDSAQTIMTFGGLPEKIKISAENYLENFYNREFIEHLEFKHAQVIACEYWKTNIGMLQYEIAYIYSDTINGIGSYNFRFLLDSLGQVIEKGNFKSNKYDETILLSRRKIDKIAAMRNVGNADKQLLNYRNATMAWECRKRRKRVYIDAFTGKVLEVYRIPKRTPPRGLKK